MIFLIKYILGYKDKSEEEFMDIQFEKSQVGAMYDEIYLKEYLFLKKNPKYNLFFRSYLPKTKIRKLGNAEKRFACINTLTKKDILTHFERFTLLLFYLTYGEEGEKRLHQVLSKCKNYKFKKTQYYIDNLKKKGGSKGITCKKLQEWGICIGQDCPIFRK